MELGNGLFFHKDILNRWLYSSAFKTPLITGLRHGLKLLAKSVCGTAPESLFWPPTVYQDLRTRRDWPVKESHSPFADQVEGKFEMYFREFVESVVGPEKEHRCCFADVTNQGLLHDPG